MKFVLILLLAATIPNVVLGDSPACQAAVTDIYDSFNDPTIGPLLDEVVPYDHYLVDLSKCMIQGGSTADAVYEKVKSHCITSYKLQSMTSQYLLAQNLCDNISSLKRKDLGSPVLNILAGITGLGAAIVGFVFPPATLAIASLAILSSTFWAIDGMRNFKNNMSQQDKNAEVVKIMEAVNSNHETISFMGMACEDVKIDKLYAQADKNGDCNRFKKQYMQRICAGYYNNGLPPLYFEDCNSGDFDAEIMALPYTDLIELNRLMPMQVRAKALTAPKETVESLVEGTARISTFLGEAVNDPLPANDRCTGNLIVMFDDKDKIYEICDGTLVSGEKWKIKQTVSMCDIPPIIDKIEAEETSLFGKKIPLHLYPSTVRNNVAAQDSLKKNFIALKDEHNVCCDKWTPTEVESCYVEQYREKKPRKFFSMSSWKTPKISKKVKITKKVAKAM